MPSPAEQGTFLVRLLLDQQNRVIWYFYLGPLTEAFVVRFALAYEAWREEKIQKLSSTMRRNRGARSCGVRRRSRSLPIRSGWRTGSGMRPMTVVCHNSSCALSPVHEVSGASDYDVIAGAVGPALLLGRHWVCHCYRLLRNCRRRIAVADRRITRRSFAWFPWLRQLITS